MSKPADTVQRETGYESIFVLGPSSSGKTTLCDELARSLNVPNNCYIREIARDVMKAHPEFSRNTTDTYEMQAAIMAAQLKAEKRVWSTRRALTESKLVLLSDRSAIDPIIYATTAKVPTASESRRRLIEDTDLHEVLQEYRQSLFGE